MVSKFILVAVLLGFFLRSDLAIAQGAPGIEVLNKGEGLYIAVSNGGKWLEKDRSYVFEVPAGKTLGFPLDLHKATVLKVWDLSSLHRIPSAVLEWGMDPASPQSEDYTARYTFTKDIPIFLTWDPYFHYMRPQTGTKLGLSKRSVSGFSLENNVLMADIEETRPFPPTLKQIKHWLALQTNYSVTAGESELLERLYSAIGTKTNLLFEILRGANVVIRDHGELYRDLSGLTPRSRFKEMNPFKRRSSHPSKDQQYGITLGKNLRTILMGTSPEGDTWFQLEGAPWGKGASFSDSAQHISDFLKYRLTGKNQGPRGNSPHVDRKPIDVKKPVVIQDP